MEAPLLVVSNNKSEVIIEAKAEDKAEMKVYSVNDVKSVHNLVETQEQLVNE